MSNSWFYRISFPAQMMQQDTIEHMIDLVAAEGYAINNPDTSLISMMSLDGMEALDFEEAETALAFLSAHGGLINLWKQDSSLALIFVPIDTPEVAGFRDLADQPASAWAQISISVDGFYFRDQDIMIADDAYKLFARIADMPGAIYGYSTDDVVSEYVLEHMPDRKVLFWLNYFSNELIEQIGREHIQSLGATITPTRHGVIVSLFQRPWDVDAGVLQRYHDAWQALLR